MLYTSVYNTKYKIFTHAESFWTILLMLIGNITFSPIQSSWYIFVSCTGTISLAFSDRNQLNHSEPRGSTTVSSVNLTSTRFFSLVRLSL